MKTASLMISTVLVSAIMFTSSLPGEANAGGVKGKIHAMTVKTPKLHVQPRVKVRIKAPTIRKAPKTREKIIAKSTTDEQVDQDNKVVQDPRGSGSRGTDRNKTATSEALSRKSAKSRYADLSLIAVPVPTPAPRENGASANTPEEIVGLHQFDDIMASVAAARAVKNLDPGFDLVRFDPANLVSGNSEDQSGKTVGGMTPDEFARRFGNARPPDELAGAILGKYSDLGNRGVDTPSNNWSGALRPDPTRINYSGFASDEATADVDPETGTMNTKTVNDNGTVTLKKETSSGDISTAWIQGDALLVTTESRYVHSPSSTGVHTDYRAWQTGTGGWSLRRGARIEQDENYTFDPGNINRTKTGNEETGGATPANCGAASCNASRKGYSLKDNTNDGTRSDPGPEGDVPQQQAASITQYIDQEDLVKNGVGEDGSDAMSGGAYGRLKNKGVRF